MSTATLTRPADTQVTHDPAAGRAVLSRTSLHWILLGAVVLYTVILAVRLRNTAFIDEALYINAGNAYLAHWFHDQPLGDAGAFFSGLPMLYPVLAALIDGIGGLYLVRLFSLACVLATGLALYATARHLWGMRAGMLTATTFLLSGPVVFMGWLGTFDAPVVALLALGLWLGMTRQGIISAVLLGLVLTLASMTKYTAGIFVPVVLAATVVMGVQGVRRMLIAAATVAVALGTSWAVVGESISRDLAFTTTGREALSPATTSHLLGLYADHMVFLALLGVLAVVLVFRVEGWRMRILGLGLVLSSAALPIGQLILQEAVSFEKHLGYSVMLLALPIGWALARFSRYPLMVTPVVLGVMIMALFPLVRADGMYRWSNVANVVTAIEMKPDPGLYISSATDSLDYHTRDLPGIAWDSTFELYYQGEEGIREAVDTGRYQTVILRTASLGNAEQDAFQATFLEALESSPDYGLAFQPFPASHDAGDEWLIFSRR